MSATIAWFDTVERPATECTGLRLEGEYWTVIYAGRVQRLRDGVGLRHLAQLLRHPGREFHSLDLMHAVAASGRSRAGRYPEGQRLRLDAERARVAVTKALKTAVGRIRPDNPILADHLDATVKRGYVCCYLPDPRVPIRWDW